MAAFQYGWMDGIRQKMHIITTNVLKENKMGARKGTMVASVRDPPLRRTNKPGTNVQQTRNCLYSVVFVAFYWGESSSVGCVLMSLQDTNPKHVFKPFCLFLATVAKLNIHYGF